MDKGLSRIEIWTEIVIESTSFVILQFLCEKRDVITFDAMKSEIKDVCINCWKSWCFGVYTNLASDEFILLANALDSWEPI